LGGDTSLMHNSSNTQDLSPRVVPAPRPLSSMHVLVADDNRDAADTLAELIAMEFGCQVSTAYDGRSALQSALAQRPDALVLDIRMPEFGGVDVARELARLQHVEAAENGKARMPLLLAVTGTDVSDALGDIDGCFDGAFAKPVDGLALTDLLRRHWQGESDPKQAPAELSDLLCQVARESVPILRARGNVLAFDYRGPSLVLEHHAAALHAGLYRLLCGVADMVDGGFTLLTVAVRPEPSGEWALGVQVSASGAVLAPSMVSEVFERLGLSDASGDEPSARAGICPSSGAHVHGSVTPGKGVQLGFELLCRPQQVLDAAVDAHGAQAWLIDSRAVPAALLQRRLRRLGWSVRRFTSLALAREQATGTGAEVPDLVVVAGEDAHADAGADLQAAFAHDVRCVHVVPIGSTALRGRDSASLCSVHVDPLSPGELIALTAALDRPAQAGVQPPGATGAPQTRPRLLVVDDMEVNRLVASGFAEALGYDVAVVADGLDAIRHCGQWPPDVVLMDINMAVVGGIDATQRIRLLQRLGRMPPFPIVAATANDDQATADRCRLVGMDGFLTKPLRLQALGEELRRVTLNAPQ
jgi:CheY-like chemotaxis protein